MSATYIESQVQRVNRNLMLVNGGILGLMLLFFAFMLMGGVLIARSHERVLAYGVAHSGNAIYHQPAALDVAHPTRISAADVASPDRLAQLEGHAVTYSDQQAQDLMFPVCDWMGRATGKNKPHLPPTYRASIANGHLFLILPAKPDPGKTFTGVIRPLTDADYNPVHPVLMGRGLPQEIQPFILDCLSLAPPTRAPPLPVEMHPVGSRHQSPQFLIVFGLIVGLSGWNVFKAASRLKNPLAHPIYTRLARYGHPPDLAHSIEAERQAGVTVLAPAEFTYSWLLVPSFWSLDAVPLDQLAWAFKMVVFVNFVPMNFKLRVMDRQGKGHPISTSDGQMTRIMDYIGQVRPWVVLGYSREIRNRFACDRAGFLAELDARHQRMRPGTASSSTPLMIEHELFGIEQRP